MKETVNVRGVYREHVSSELWNSLQKLVPEYDGEYVFGFEFAANDLRLPRVMDLLHAAGLQPWDSFAGERDRTTQFALDMYRTYNQAELAEFELLELVPQECARLDSVQSDQNATLVAEASELLADPGRGVAFSWGKETLLNDRVRRILEHASLKQFDFRPVELRCPAGAKRAPDWSLIPGGPWWWLRAALALPPASPRLDIRPVPTNPDMTRTCYLVEGFYRDPEIRYARSALRSIASFDIARTKEPFFGRHRLIVSHTFFELSRQQLWPFDFRPVRIDEDL